MSRQRRAGERKGVLCLSLRFVLVEEEEAADCLYRQCVVQSLERVGLPWLAATTPGTERERDHH